MIFSIDPGTTQSAFVQFDSEKKLIINKGIIQNDELLSLLENLEINKYEIPINYEL